MSNLKPAKEQYRVFEEFDAPIENCFAAGTAEDAMMYWVADVASVTYDHSKASEPYGAGSERLVKMKNGMSLVEKIDISQAPTFLAYHIPDFGKVGNLLLQNYQGHMKFESLGPRKTRLTWIAHFDTKGLGKIIEPLVRSLFKKNIVTFAARMRDYVEKQQAS